MTNKKLNRLLTASVSGLVIAASMGDVAYAANVGTSTTNSTTASGTGVLYIFDVANGTLTNSGTINSTNSVAVAATGVTGAVLTNTGTISGIGQAVQAGNGAQITNSAAGTISASSGSAIVATGTSGAVITNAGTISAASSGATGTILAGAGTTVTNSGTISATSGSAIVATGTGTVGITNSSTGTITTSDTTNSAIVISAGTGTNTLTNAGTISAPSGTAITIGAATVGTTVTNTGTITAANTAIQVATNTTAATINNNGGTITTTGSNAGKGTIEVLGNAAITNTGTISATGATSAIRVGSGTSSSTITNSAGGSIKTTGTGAAITVNSTLASITNAGTIESTGGTGIIFGAGTTLTNGLTNTGSIIGTGGDAIDHSASSTALTITNSGTITGNVKLGSGADILNVSGGTISGNIVGAGSTNTVNFTGNFTTAGTITGVNAVNVTGGTLTVATGISATTLTNSSKVAIASNQTVTGNYTQAAAGTLQTAITSRTAAAKLTVSGTATLADSSTISAQIASGVKLQSGDSFTVLSAGTLTATAANLTVTDNDPFVILTASKSTNDLLLTASTATSAQAASSVLTSSGFASTAALQTAAGGGSAGTNIGQTFSSYINLLSTLRDTNTTNYDLLNTRLSALSGANAVRAIQTLQPTAAVSAGTTSASVSAGTASGNVILARLDGLRAAESGMAAGEKYGRNAKAWFQPFGSQLEQDRKDGIDGYDADTTGVLFGGDLNVSENIRAGLALGYNKTNVDATGTSARSGSDIDGYGASVYANYTKNSYYFDALVGFQFNEYDVHRYSSLNNDIAKANYEGNQYNARIAGGYDFKQASGLVVTPNAAFNYTFLDQDGYTERGALINNRVNSNSAVAATSDIGIKAAYPIKRATGTLTPQIRASWMHEFGDKDQSSTSTFVGGTQAFTTKGAKIDEDAGRIGLGLGFQTLGNTKISLDADYVARDTSDAVSGQLNVKVPF